MFNDAYYGESIVQILEETVTCCICGWDFWDSRMEEYADVFECSGCKLIFCLNCNNPSTCWCGTYCNECGIRCMGKCGDTYCSHQIGRYECQYCKVVYVSCSVCWNHNFNLNPIHKRCSDILRIKKVLLFMLLTTMKKKNIVTNICHDLYEEISSRIKVYSFIKK